MRPDRSTATATSTAIWWSSSNGDPTINPRHPERWASFDEWAQAARREGHPAGQRPPDRRRQRVRRARLGPRLGVGRPRLRLRRRRRRAAIQREPGRAADRPGPEAGARAIISVSPPGSGITIDHQRHHGGGGEAEPHRPAAHAGFDDADGERPGRARLAGDHRVRRRRQSRRSCISTRCARRLARHGIFIGGTPLDIDDGADHAGYEQGDAAARGQVAAARGDHRRRAEVEPQRLRGDAAALDGARRRAEVRRRAASTASTRRSTTGASSRGAYVARDGSGLSRYDYLTADALTWLLTYMWTRPERTRDVPRHAAGSSASAARSRID